MSIGPKYRKLTLGELEELEKEFVDFLIVNGIVAKDWVRIKSNNPEKAEDIVTLFSDAVLEGAMRKIVFLEYRSPQDIKTFQCLEDKIILMGMCSENTAVDFTDDDFFSQAAIQPPKDIQVYTSEKMYAKKREAELFDMIENGCQISNGQAFKGISLALYKDQ